MGKFNQRNKSSAHKRNNKKFAPDPCKSDEDIVKDSIHLFYLDIDELLTNPNTTRRYKKMLRTGIGNPPRPQNAFMLNFKNQLKIRKTETYEESSVSSRSSSTETFPESSPYNPPIPQINDSQPSTVSSNPRLNEVIASPNSTNYVSQSSTESFEFDSIISSICDNIQDYDIIYDSFDQPYLFNTKTDQICFLPNINFDNYQTNEMMLNTSQQPCIIQQPELANIPQQSYNELANTIQQPELPTIPQQSYNGPEFIQQPELQTFLNNHIMN
ncbi:unnamed protein product [Rhizophagus irregularis]|nr:unnamed protein product [Rhizophagus irregularis]